MAGRQTGLDSKPEIMLKIKETVSNRARVACICTLHVQREELALETDPAAHIGMKERQRKPKKRSKKTETGASACRNLSTYWACLSVAKPHLRHKKSCKEKRDTRN